MMQEQQQEHEQEQPQQQQPQQLRQRRRSRFFRRAASDLMNHRGGGGGCASGSSSTTSKDDGDSNGAAVSLLSSPSFLGGADGPALPRTTTSPVPDEAASVTTEEDDDDDPRSRRQDKWLRPYEPEPVVSQSSILAFGFFLFVVAMIWPPLLLLIAYLLSKLIPYSFRANDEASARRQLFNEFSLFAHCGGASADSGRGDPSDTGRCGPGGGDDDCCSSTDGDGDDHRPSDFPENFKEIPEHIHLEESFWTNARGMSLCTVTMTPTRTPVRAVACFCHGYCDNASYYKMVEYQRLVERGIAFVAVEYEGHGRSDGPLGLIADWDRMVEDVSTYFHATCRERFPNVPTFLVGESMGGAVAYSVYNRMPELFRGVVFICPMCKISDDMLPPEWVVHILQWLAGPTGTCSWIGYLPIAPARNELKNLTHRDPAKGRNVSRCPTSFCRNPRLATARELVQTTKRISASLREFDAPFLVLHGRADRVTDPKLSQLLYAESRSKDKSIRLYDGMWHALTCGEPDENIDRVFNDCIEWILERTDTTSDTSSTATPSTSIRSPANDPSVAAASS